MGQKIYRVLFLSRRNSARSILAEAILNRDGQGRFRAYSAGVAPAAAIDPHVVELLKSNGFPVDELRAKHFRDFAAEGAHDLDFVFTLSDTAAHESLPEWPGLPVTAHWSSPDPILAEAAEWERKQAFARIMSELERRLRILISLPLESLDRMSLKTKVDEIGRTQPSH
ncbi:MAG TPA: arsenate reductase ArsC [Dongiaceae bacterium]|jgi:protein-tyrosine-phosphatase|nr:arsenate reductase ArsC [Dongiaceae bacterium]